MFDLIWGAAVACGWDRRHAFVMTSRCHIWTSASIYGKGLVVRVLPSLEQHRPKHDQGDDKNDEDLDRLNLREPELMALVCRFLELQESL